MLWLSADSKYHWATHVPDLCVLVCACWSLPSSMLSYTFALIFNFSAVLSLCRAFVPTKSVPSSNSTEWMKIKGLFEGLASNGGYFFFCFLHDLCLIVCLLAFLSVCPPISFCFDFVEIVMLINFQSDLVHVLWTDQWHCYCDEQFVVAVTWAWRLGKLCSIRFQPTIFSWW